MCPQGIFPPIRQFRMVPSGGGVRIAGVGVSAYAPIIIGFASRLENNGGGPPYPDLETAVHGRVSFRAFKVSPFKVVNRYEIGHNIRFF
jgi:hypothetical protein